MNPDKDYYDDGEEREFEFPLFSGAPVSAGRSAGTADGAFEGAAATQRLRIRLRSPTPGEYSSTEGRFVKPFRGWRYYFSTGALLLDPNISHRSLDLGRRRLEDDVKRKRAEFEDVAVDGRTVLAEASNDWVSTYYHIACGIPFSSSNLNV